MKKLIAIFACLFCITPALAETYLRVETDQLYTIGKQYFPDANNLALMLSEYSAQLDATGNQGVSATGMWAVCLAGNIDIKTSAGKQQCTAFTNSLMMFADTEYYAVCDGAEYNKIPAEVREKSVCERDFFNWTNVQLASAVTLAQEYARIKYNDSIICSQKYRQRENDDWIQCKSTTSGAFYEFKFDDVRESIDNKIQKDISTALCRMHTGQYGIDSGQLGQWAGTYEKTCVVDNAEQCDKIAESAKLFGATTEFGENEVCYIKFKAVEDASELRTACGIDNFEFCRGIQANTGLSMIDALKQYTGNQCGVSPAMITCDNSFNTYRGAGCAVTTFNPKDDIVTCYYNGQPIDYVFDDVNEAWKKYANSAEQAMMCINADGTFDGKHCVALGEAMCDELKAQNEVSCPMCQDIIWDDDNNLCILPDSRSATRLQNGVKIATVAGTVVVAVTATVLTAGTGAVAIAGSVLVGVGGAGVITAEAVMTYGIFDPFVKKAQQCFLDNDVACAENLLMTELNRMQGYKEELTAAQQRGLDDIFVRLVEMLPDDSKFWTEFFGNPEFFDCDESGNNCAVKSPTQFWQVARTVGDVMMMVGGLVNIANNYTQMVKLRDAVPARVSDNLNKSGLLHNVNVTGAPGTAVSNTWLQSISGINGWPANITNSQLVQQLGLSVGDRIWFTPAGRMLTGVSATAAQNLGASIVADVVAGGNLVFHNLEDSDALVISRLGGDDDQVAPVLPILDDDIEIPDDDIIDDDQIDVGDNQPIVSPIPTPDPIPVPTLPVLSDDIDIPDMDLNFDDKIDVGDTRLSVDKRTYTETSEHNVERKNNAGLIAAAAVVGAVGTGALIGALVAGGDDDDDAQQTPQQSEFEIALGAILDKANGVVGRVQLQIVTLAKLLTTGGSYAPIVNVNGNAVVVAIYQGQYYPYYLDANTNRWTALHSIDQTTGQIQPYSPYPTGNAVIDGIGNVLDTELTPNIIRQVLVQNSLGVGFPAPAASAYVIINGH